MKFLFKLVLAALLALLSAVAVALWMALQAAPLVAHSRDVSTDDVEHARRLIEKNDPRNAAGRGPRSLDLSQHDVDLMLDHAAQRFFKAAARVVLQPGAAVVQVSLPVNAGPLGRWINIDALLRETNALPEVDHLMIGTLPVPAFLADRLLTSLLAYLDASAESRIASDLVRGVSFAQGRMQVVYQWSDDIPKRLLEALLPQPDQERIHAYSDRLVDVAQAMPGGSVSLARLLPPMFELARQRSASGEAALEIRAALIALAFYANGRGLSAIIPAAKSWRQPRLLAVTLNARNDSPLHFLISAALAAEAGSRLSDAIGLYKEVDDSRGGSGFSFNDLAADRAGTRFGELALNAPNKLQAAMVPGLTERDFMPDVADLEESIQAADFKRRFGSTDSPAYQKIMAGIEQRVAASPIFR